ncbi:Pentatricopeptide repeat-containing protein At2g20540 [Linum perenne]
MPITPSTRCLNLLKKCKTFKQLHQAQAQSITCGLGENPFTLSRILAFYAAAADGGGCHAWSLFQTIRRPTICICNTTIKSLLLSIDDDDLPKVFQVYSTVFRIGMYPDDYTVPYVLKACSRLGSRLHGEVVHGSSVKLGVELFTVVGNSLISMYCGFSDVGDAAGKVFDEMPSRCVVSWTLMVSGFSKSGDAESARLVFDCAPRKDGVLWGAMISGYVQNGCFKECLYLFRMMQVARIDPDEGIFSSILAACAQLGALDTGMWIHRHLSREGARFGTRLGTALVDMYVKCGSLVLAKELFDEIHERDVVCWNVMISGLAMHGDAKNAVKLVSEMEAARVQPDDVTFLTVLSACSHSNMAAEGLMMLEKMCEVYGIEPKSEHLGCIVDLLSREGLLREAASIIEKMKTRSSSSEEEAIAWRALLNACCNQGDSKLAEIAAERVFKLEQHSGAYALLGNLYASAGKYDEARRIRTAMRNRGVEKVPGCSSIEIGGSVREFVAGEKTHLEMEEIKSVLENMQHIQPEDSLTLGKIMDFHVS